MSYKDDYNSNLPEPEIDYYLALMEGMVAQYAQASQMCSHMGKHNEAMFYRGKADATREAIGHYLKLHNRTPSSALNYLGPV